MCSVAFFFTAPSTSTLYTLSLHDALPIYAPAWGSSRLRAWPCALPTGCAVLLIVLCVSLASLLLSPRRLLVRRRVSRLDRKSTRLNSSHITISYAVFCLKKKTDACHMYSL